MNNIVIYKEEELLQNPTVAKNATTENNE